MSRIHLLLAAVFLSSGLPAHADKVDDFINAQLNAHHVPGLSLAIIDGGKIVKARGYGVTDTAGGGPVTAATLFQAGSISKSVAALGALHLVEQGRLALDEDVNAKLTTWKVPDNEFTGKEKVTLRRLLSHTAGLTVHGFAGYGVGEPRPTLVQALNGEKPANSPAIRVDMLPGSKWRYSGGGYTVLQQMILDVTGQPFPAFMQQTVLAPLHMSHSTYEQPLPGDKAVTTASGYYADGKPVKGRWHIYPEMAAAGLWTTASDLATFAIGVQRSLAGTSNPVISQAMTRQMLTDQKDGDGLGVFLQGKGHDLRFMHDGRDEGFDAVMVSYAETGQGAVIMINANSDSRMVPHILETIATEYHWLNYPITPVYSPIPDTEPAVTAALREMLDQLAEGKVIAARCTPEIANLLATQVKEGLQEALHAMGPVKSMVLLEHRVTPKGRMYRYRAAYAKDDFTLMVLCGFNPEGKISVLSMRPE